MIGGKLRQIGQDVSDQLEYVPGRFKVIRHVRPKLACVRCEGIFQALAPSRPISRGLPGPALLAHVMVAKYCDHTPLYRQSGIYAREGVDIERSTMAGWVGQGDALLDPLAAALGRYTLEGAKVHADDTPVPVLDPGRGRTKTGYLWAIARDDRPWGGPAPPGVVYTYAPGRGGEHALACLVGFHGVLQVDAYAAYNALADRGGVKLAYCWAHLRRDFFDIAAGGNAPIASEALQRIAALYAIEEKIRGRSADERHAVRQTETKPLIEALKTWLEQKLEIVAKRGRLGEAIRYGLTRWEGFTRFLDDGCIEIDSNIVERSIRPIALNRKNALFAGSDEGGVAWGVVASLIKTCKLNGVEPHSYLADVLAKLADRWPMSRIDELLPWAYIKPAAAVA